MNWRLAASVLLGLFLAGAAIAGLEALIHQTLTGEAIFGGAAAALGIAAAIGGAVAVLLGRTPFGAWLVAGGLGALSLVNMSSFPHPVWFAPAAAAALIAGAWIATRVARS